MYIPDRIDQSPAKSRQLLKSNTITWTRSIILNHNWKWSSGESWHQKPSLKPSHNRYHMMFSSSPWRISPRPAPNWSPYLSRAQESCRAWWTKGILSPLATRFQLIKIWCLTGSREKFHICDIVHTNSLDFLICWKKKKKRNWLTEFRTQLKIDR